MISIKVDKEFAEYLSTNKLKIDEVFILGCFCQNKLPLLKTVLTGRNPDQCTAYLQPLERKMLIYKLSNIEEFDWDNYEVSEVGHKVYSEIKNFMESIDLPLIAPAELTESKLSEFALEWLELWPDVKNAAGERLRSNPIDVTKKLESFMTKYKIKDKELIKSSTQKYLDRMKLQSYQYCSCAMYFIIKDGVSKLANECMSKDEASIVNPWNDLA